MLTQVDVRQNKPRHRGIETHPSDPCRICQCDFKVKFVTTASQPSTTGYVSSENWFKPSKTKETYGQILADICRAAGKEAVENNSQFSERVSNPCARKIRNSGTYITRTEFDG